MISTVPAAPPTRSGPAIGIPRALAYYLYPALWETFFTELGMSVILSAPTSRQTITRAGLISESEHCLPVKLFDAHLAELAEQTSLIFVPRILSTRPGHIACPKLGALPDCARAQLPDRITVLTAAINERLKPLPETLAELARKLNFAPSTASRAIPRALAALAAARQAQAQPFPLSPPATSAPTDQSPEARTSPWRCLMIGHPYNLHDPYLSDPIGNAFAALGVVVTPVSFAAPETPPGPLQWDTCSIILRQLQQLDPTTWDGVIQLSSFNCGCDSIAGVLFREAVATKNLPLLTLVLDEHSAPTGIETRIEAFVDTIAGRKTKP